MSPSTFKILSEQQSYLLELKLYRAKENSYFVKSLSSHFEKSKWKKKKKSFCKTFHTFNLNRLISHVTNVGYHINRIFPPWCQNSYRKMPIINRKTYSMAMGTNHHLAAILNQVLHGPRGSYPKFFSGYSRVCIPTNFFVHWPMIIGQRPRSLPLSKH